MALEEFSRSPARTRIGIVGTIPTEALDVFAARGFACYQVPVATPISSNILAQTDSIIITQRANDFIQIVGALQKCAEALDYDCRIYVRVANDPRSFALLLRALEKLRLPVSGIRAKAFEIWREGPNEEVFGPFVRLVPTNDNWNSIANLVLQNPAGPAPTTKLAILAKDSDQKELPRLSIHPRKTKHNAVNLSDTEIKTLLRRAFEDCAKISLQKKTNGLSGVDTYEAFAEIRKDRRGSGWPYRFFVKIGQRSIVAKEFTKYQTAALSNVPFHLGPRLRPVRCVLGHKAGILVSDYVSGAEPLRDCVLDGRGTAAIANLFNHTLLPWRRAATEEMRPLGQILYERIANAEVPAHRQSRIDALGATGLLPTLRAQIRDCKSMPVLVGVIHGDLHATNVLIRMQDAVIIDMEKIESLGPLLFDVASLEGGLLIDGFAKDTRPVPEILRSISELYEVDSLLKNDHYCSPDLASTWFFDCIRQIRMQSKQIECEPLQYAWTLALVLLKKSCNEDDFVLLDGPEKGGRKEECRAMAFALAERILKSLDSYIKAKKIAGLKIKRVRGSKATRTRSFKAKRTNGRK